MTKIYKAVLKGFVHKIMTWEDFEKVGKGKMIKEIDKD